MDKINIKNRLNNYGLWTSLLSLLGLILVDVFNIELGHYQQYVDIILPLLISLGILSDPNSGKWYNDK